MIDPAAIWQGFMALPIGGLSLTIFAFLLMDSVQRRCGGHALANPLAIALLIILLIATDTSYESYFASARYIHLLLGPATVALAIPLYRHFGKLRSRLLPLSVALLCGCLTAILSATLLAKLCGASTAAILSLAPKSVTAPIAMGIAVHIGAEPSLVAAMVVMTGILGAVGGPWFLSRLRIRDAAARGFAIGLSAHGLGTARAFEESEEAGSFSALGMGLNGLLTALILPYLLPLLAFYF